MATEATWMGAIPNNWGSCPLKHIFEIQKRIAGKEGYTVLSITQSGIKPKNMSAQGQYAQDYSNYQLVYPGDFAMNHMDLLTGWVDISQHEGVTSPDYRVFVNRDASRFCSEYYKFIFQYCYSNKIFYGMGQGVSGFGRWRLPADMFLNFRLPVPSLEEQAKIASFLDQKICDIDAVITEARASIEEYKVWKASIIHEAVTKGLDPNVEMKDSGIEWIGAIPSNWNIMRLKYFISGYKAGPFGSALITDRLNHSGNILVYTPEHIAKKTVNLDKNLYLPDERRDEMAQFIVEPGDIIFPIVGSLGRSMLITDEMPTGIINQRLAKFKLNTEKLTMDYFMWLFSKSTFYSTFIELNCRGSIIVNLTKQIVCDMPVPLPASTQEQQQIVEHLERKCGSIDSLIGEKEMLIAELESYKKSLLFEVVTGKRKVV